MQETSNLQEALADTDDLASAVWRHGGMDMIYPVILNLKVVSSDSNSCRMWSVSLTFSEASPPVSYV